VTLDDVWEFKTVEQRGKQLVEDGKPQGSGTLNQRVAELSRQGWDLIALSAHECRFRRRKRHVSPAQITDRVPTRRGA
jgi:hypothetical protein